MIEKEDDSLKKFEERVIQVTGAESHKKTFIGLLECKLGTNK